MFFIAGEIARGCSTWYEVLRVLMICLCAEQGEEKEIGEDGHQDLVEEVNSHSQIVVASFSHH